MIVLVFIIVVAAMIWMISKSFAVGTQVGAQVMATEQSTAASRETIYKQGLVDTIHSMIVNTKSHSFHAMHETQLLILEIANPGINEDVYKEIIAKSYISIDREVMKSFLNIFKATNEPYAKFADYVDQCSKFSLATGIQKNNIHLLMYSADLSNKNKENNCFEDWITIK